MNDIIQILNISKSFNSLKKIKVLKKISYNFKKGKIYSIIGPSGSGKSTLLNLLSLIDKPNSGSIKIVNNQINFNDSKNNDLLRANKIGIIYQQDNLLTDFTALENIYLASLAAGNNKQLSITKSKILLKKVGLLNRSDHYPSQLSGGEKQRVSIARALINNPQIIEGDVCNRASNATENTCICSRLLKEDAPQIPLQAYQVGGLKCIFYLLYILDIYR